MNALINLTMSIAVSCFAIAGLCLGAAASIVMSRWGR